MPSGPVAKKKVAKRKTAKKKVAKKRAPEYLGPPRHKGLVPTLITKKNSIKKEPKKSRIDNPIGESVGLPVGGNGILMKTVDHKGRRHTEQQITRQITRQLSRGPVKMIMGKMRQSVLTSKRDHARSLIVRAKRNIQPTFAVLRSNTLLDASDYAIKSLRSCKVDPFNFHGVGADYLRLRQAARDAVDEIDRIEGILASFQRTGCIDLAETERQIWTFFRTRKNARYYNRRLYWSIDGFRLRYDSGDGNGPLEIILGPYDINMPCYIGLDNSVFVWSQEGAWYDGTKNHPHVKEGVMCQGEAQNMIRVFLRTGRIMDAVNIVETTLNTYYSGSPWITFKNSYLSQIRQKTVEEQRRDTYTCEKCGYANHRIENFTVCEICKRTVCTYNGCGKHCSACDTTTCKKCELHATIQCNTCGKLICYKNDPQKHSYIRCPSCATRTCDDCRKKQENPKGCPVCSYNISPNVEYNKREITNWRRRMKRKVKTT